MENKNYGELIPNRIFTGGIDAIDELLANEKIDVIYDLRAEVKGPLSSDISVHQPIVDDAKHQDESIKIVVSKVIEAYNAGKNVYFHCNTGRGRAGTIATATLLELGHAHSIDEAELRAKEIRSNINVKPQFKEALKRIYEYEKK
ncbi:protein-tyrosine phosphatase family protein [Sporosarcina sp. G11-34]|uniref:protein-tyrosine phosphatase family protein n=1 Tax=Sporosarcina sp. G11-34 TaxID=2849605 RepID=UPI0022A92B07|nr:dual specificity protein phosphatase family protein [Sporosarcina sp. G11-34]MCZ2257908.1 dual specificity protein phosphatase family protein [Sporosarcina sp. G11-34]